MGTCCYPAVRLQGVPHCGTSMGGNSEHTCGRYAQVEELLCSAAVLQEEVSRLRSIRESAKEIVYWNPTFPGTNLSGRQDT